ncbi:MAG TPA: sulfite exporter TauE/SafE family protein, partial [Alphaproteobacteria bacterium]|nr:sulfite exporter TauE/SafE family protein [Alphaproteobacteria bacterium]HBF98998.1 sulfite exporter TauE/SafE family protein [Alphaproteobacteria bacterium]
PESHHQDRHDAGTHNEDGQEMMHHSEDHSTHH